jgi:ribokinase
MDSGQRRPHIVVVGSYAVGLVMRVPRVPAVGETVLGYGFAQMDGGKGSNQAVACARLGAEVTFVAAIGDDAFGDRALALLAHEGVDTTFVRRVDATPTGIGFITVAEDGDNAIAVDLGANRCLAPDDVDRAEQRIAAADALLVQLEIPVSTAMYALGVARRHGTRAILNPAPAQPIPAEHLGCADILTPNSTEAAILSGHNSAAGDALARALHEATGTSVVLTMGERGAAIADATGSRTVPACAVDVVDTTGAGDGFSAALAVALAEGRDLNTAVAFACAAGAYCVQRAGTVPSYGTHAQIEALFAPPTLPSVPRS